MRAHDVRPRRRFVFRRRQAATRPIGRPLGGPLRHASAHQGGPFGGPICAAADGARVSGGARPAQCTTAFLEAEQGRVRAPLGRSRRQGTSFRARVSRVPLGVRDNQGRRSCNAKYGHRLRACNAKYGHRLRACNAKYGHRLPASELRRLSHAASRPAAAPAARRRARSDCVSSQLPERHGARFHIRQALA